MKKHDVAVVGAGNAAMVAALSACQQGKSVVVLEAAGEKDQGGNTRYAAGQMRTVYRGVEDIRCLVPDLTNAEAATSDFGAYKREDYLEDVMRLTQYRCDPDLIETLIDNSFETLVWMKSVGVRFQVSYGRQAAKVGGKFKFWGGLPLEAWGGGPGILDAYAKAASRLGIEVVRCAWASDLVFENGTVRGVNCLIHGRPRKIMADTVILACGGFEASAEMRARYLGPNWDLAKVRGTRFNTGQGLKMAIAIGANTAGHWSGAHSTCWDMNAPDTGDLEVGDGYQKFSYPVGIIVNNAGQRFVDEGADFQTFTYARIGREILRQPGLQAWQIFDQRGVPFFRDEYRIKKITKATGATMEELVQKMEGVDGEALLKTVREFNAAVPVGDPPIDLSVKDGRKTVGLQVPKSNWAYPLDQGPFLAFGVTTGITFTFGGLRISPRAEVLNVAGEPIPGLYAAGEIVGGIFYDGYPGGTGLVSGAVFGRIAGLGAASFCSKRAA